MQRGRTEGPTHKMEGQEKEGGRAIQVARLDGRGKAHLVVAKVKYGIVGPEEDISKDPHGLATLSGQRDALKAHHAVAVLLFNRETEFTHLLRCGQGVLQP